MTGNCTIQVSKFVANECMNCLSLFRCRRVPGPDFPTGGLADISKYNDGIKGGRGRVRARIQQMDKKTLVITEVPYGNTTTSLIDSIVAANEKGKIKIPKIDDNTAEKVEIELTLTQGASQEKAIQAPRK